MAIWGVYGSGLAGAGEGTFARRYAAGEGWQSSVRITVPAKVGPLIWRNSLPARGRLGSQGTHPAPLKLLFVVLSQ